MKMSYKFVSKIGELRANAIMNCFVHGPMGKTGDSAWVGRYQSSKMIGSLNTMNGAHFLRTGSVLRNENNMKAMSLFSNVTVYSFCNAKIPIRDKDPDNRQLSRKEPEKKVNTPLQNVLKQIDQMTKSPITSESLQKITRRIQMSGGLSSSDKKSVVKYLTTVLFKNNFPAEELLSNVSIKRLQKGQHFVQLETVMFVISQQKSKGKGNSDLVNDLFLKCFNEILPQSQGNEKLKCEVLLFKNFGKHLIENGHKDKGLSMIEKSIQKHKELILEQYNRMQNFVNSFDKQSKSKTKTKAQKQRHELQTNALKENIRRLMQSNFQTLYYYYQCKRDKMSSTSSGQISKQQQEIVSICYFIKESMALKSLVPKVQLYSRYYHRLMQVFYELELSYALMRRDQAKVREINTSMKQFFKECNYELEQLQHNLEVLREVIQVIFRIKMHLSRLQHGSSLLARQKIKEDVSQCGIQVIEAGRMQEGSIQKQMATKILADFLKKNLK